MILRKLKIQNIGRYADEEIDFQPSSLSLIVGSNGAGKTTIFESILWCLFGKTAKEVSLDEVVRLGQESGSVELTITSDENEYRVVRVRDVKRQASSLKLFVNGEDASSPTIPETEEKIQTYLRTSFITFRNSIFFGQNEISQFISGTDKERKDILTKFLDLEIYDRALDVVKKRLTELKAKITTLDTESQGIKYKLESLAGYQNQITQLTAKRVEIEQKRDEELKKFQKVDHSARIAQIDEQLSVIQGLKGHRDKIQNLYNDVRFKTSRLQQYRQDLNSLDASMDQPCPTCGQAMPKEARLQSRQKIIRDGNALKIEIDQTFTNLGIDQIKNFNDLANFLSDLNGKIQAEGQLMGERSKLDTEMKQSSYAGVEQSYQMGINSLNESIEKLKQELTQADPLKSRLAIIDNEKAAIDVQVKRYQTLEVAYGPNGVKSSIIQSIVDVLEEEINFFISKLSTGISVSLETSGLTKSGTAKEKFLILVHDLIGKRELKSYSGGEKRVIALAIRFAFASLALRTSNSSLQFLLLDEVTDALDSSVKESFYTLLTTLRQRYQQIFVISHDSLFRDFFEETLSISKDQAGVSHIER